MNATADLVIRVLVVDDSPFVRKALTRILNAAPDIQVVASAASSEEALAAVALHRPDVITLDVLMPGADGLETLRRIMSESPLPVVMVSALTTSNAHESVEALSIGAIDVVAKPTLYPNMNIPAIGEELLDKVRIAAGVDPSHFASRAAERPHAAPPKPHHSGSCPSQGDSLVVIGCSTGGPPALASILSSLPGDFPLPILVVQHMPRRFTTELARRLNGLSELAVKEAADGDVIRPGRVLVARAGEQMHVVQTGDGTRIVRLDRRPPDTVHMPSVDVTMSDAAAVYGAGTLAVLLTGMGADGADGMRLVKDAGGITIAESQRTAIVWGMPKAAIEQGCVDHVLDLSAVAESLCALAADLAQHVSEQRRDTSDAAGF